MASAHIVKVLEQTRVSPPPGSVPQASLPLTFFDIWWLYLHPVQRLFFYHFPHPTTCFIEWCLPKLKASLSLTLQHFYPLAGHVRPSPDSDDKYELSYMNGDTVSFTLAECDGDFQDFSGSCKCDFAKVHPLIPQLPEPSPLQPVLALQVTVFPNNGISIGVTMHHVACDGLSTSHFMKSWALACGSGGIMTPPSPLPLLDRAMIADPRGLYSIILNESRANKTDQPLGSWGIATLADGVLKTFTLRRDHIQKLKQRALAKAGPFHCSTFVLACAHVWVCHAKTRGCMSNTTAHFGFLMDCRQRLRPPIPTSYIGNCLRPCFVELNRGHLIGEDGVLAASKAIGEAIKEAEAGVLDGAEGWMQRIISVASARPLSVAGSPKFRVYDTDFGWGRPQKVVVASIQQSGAISLAESREEPGGVEVGLVLLEHEMDEFETHFFRGLEHLSK